MEVSERKTRQIFYNRPQALAMLIQAKDNFHVMGRGTGKSTGILAPSFRRDIFVMPRSVGFLVTPTYQMALSLTLPALMGGFGKLGLYKDVNYAFGHKAPKVWGWKEPYEPPLDYKNCFHFFNGSVIQLASQDLKMSSQGRNADYAKGDEAKALDWPKFLNDTLPTLRANMELFKEIPWHRGLTFTTSMPTSAESKWIFEQENEMDRDLIELILAYSLEINKFKNEQKSASETKIKVLQRQVNKLVAKINPLRKDAVYYNESSTFENISVLTPKYIADMRRIMTDSIFNAEIRNVRPEMIEGGFYPLLDLQKHLYTDFNNSYLENISHDFEKIKEQNCRQDNDCIDALPLWIAVDWGAKINCMSVGQKQEGVRRVINALHVLHPDILDDLAKKFVDYYDPHRHKNKDVYFTYDHTGNTKMANSQYTYSEQFAKHLTSAGWNVVMKGKKHAMTHAEKYMQNNRIMGEMEGLMAVRINKFNCKALLTSMKDAPVIDGTDGIRKDKSSERKGGPQEDATHYSDTFDLLIDAMYEDDLSFSGAVTGPMM